MSSDGSLWAITSYFNPCGYQRRLQNYRIFRQRLDVPLLAVELAYGDAEFQLQQGDAEILIQLRGQDVMWQKERLLNVGLRHLPDSCEKVAWLDCDVVFHRGDWAQRTCELLDRCVLVQPFSEAHLLPEHAKLSDLKSLPVGQVARSIAAGVALGSAPPETFDERKVMPVPLRIMFGLAWAGRLRLFRAHGLYDAAVIGGGDRLMVDATYGYIAGAAKRFRMTDTETKYFTNWATPYFEQVRDKVGYLDGVACHLWHGDAERRQYLPRQYRLREFSFDPQRDITKAENGTWRWNSAKPKMHEYVRQYFASRREDG